MKEDQKMKSSALKLAPLSSPQLSAAKPFYFSSLFGFGVAGYLVTNQIWALLLTFLLSLCHNIPQSDCSKIRVQLFGLKFEL